MLDDTRSAVYGSSARALLTQRFSGRPMVWTICASLLAGAAAFAQTTQPPANMPRPGQPGYPNYLRPGVPVSGPVPAPVPAARPSAAAAATPALMPTAVAAPSLLDKPAQPATVDVAAGKLTIQADNSSLSAILQQVSTSTGMTVDGLTRDERVFGTYGPGDPREILSSLLDGSGYNVVMFGKTTAGTPSQLALSTRGAALPSGPAGVRRGAIVQNQEDEEEPQPTQYQDNPPPAPPPANPAPGPGNPNGGVRTPQQMLQELQQMRQQQQQQQTPDQQQQQTPAPQ